MEWYLKCCLQKYAVFSGRARRKEYWMFCLFNLVFLFVFSLISNLIGPSGVKSFILLLSSLYSLVVLIPNLAVSVRRLHDIGRSGKSFFIGLIPIIGGIILLVWFCQEGEQGKNQWGENPKESSETNQNSVSKNTSNNSDFKVVNTPQPQQVKSKVELPMDRLKRLCNPVNFMENYNKEKVEIANQIYSKLMGANPNIDEIAAEAEKRLGIQLVDNHQIEDLKNKLHPKNFMNPYDAQKISLANELYSRIVDNITYSEYNKLKNDAKPILDFWTKKEEEETQKIRKLKEEREQYWQNIQKEQQKRREREAEAEKYDFIYIKILGILGLIVLLIVLIESI